MAETRDDLGGTPSERPPTTRTRRTIKPRNAVRRVEKAHATAEPYYTAPTTTFQNTDKSVARKAVLISAVAMFVIALQQGAKAKDGVGTFRRLWSVGVVFISLALLADFAPQVAGPFAVLVVLGSLTQTGQGAIQKTTGKLAKKG